MKVAHLLAAVAVLGLAFGVASAKEKKGGKGKGPKGVVGKVTAVDTTAKTITLKSKGGDVTVTTDDNTAFTVDGNAATLADVKEGMLAKITPATGTATKVDAKTAGKGHKGGGKKKANKGGDE